MLFTFSFTLLVCNGEREREREMHLLYVQRCRHLCCMVNRFVRTDLKALMVYMDAVIWVFFLCGDSNQVNPSNVTQCESSKVKRFRPNELFSLSLYSILLFVIFIFISSSSFRSFAAFTRLKIFVCEFPP